MAKACYIGPVAAKLGPSGGDMGFQFVAIFAGVVYFPIRWVEIRLWGKVRTFLRDSGFLRSEKRITPC